jgi:xylose isomerase
MSYFTGEKEYFKGIGNIKFEGKKSDNPMAFKFYDADKLIAGKTMKDHLRFACAYWHSFNANGSDPFGGSTMEFPFTDSDSKKNSIQKADAAFEFITKMGMPYYCFHDSDVAAAGNNSDEYQKNLHDMAKELKKRQDATGVKLLWNTTNAFSDKIFMNGAATNPEFDIVARAALQMKTCLDVNVELGGENYVFWGGREGYMSLLNTDMKRERDHLGKVLTMARDYGRKIGFTGNFLIEPKPMEPSKHQYDYDAQSAIAFINEFNLQNDFKCNIEANHATLAGHTFEHDLQVCADSNMLGSVDANQGDPQNGWDTDEFPSNVYDTTKAMLVILKNGGLHTGGLNFDAKRRRNSTDNEDLFLAHISGMDTFALGLEVANNIIEDGKFDSFVANRYSSFDGGNGKMFEDGKMDLESLALLGRNDGKLVSGKQEYLESLLNLYMFR